MKQIPGDEIQDENVNVEDSVVEMSGNEMKKTLHKLLRHVKKKCHSEVKKSKECNSEVKSDVKEGVVSGTRVDVLERNVAVSYINKNIK